MGKHETTISGAAITSTLNQMSMIGDIGKEILKKFKELDTEEDKIKEFKKLQDKNSHLELTKT